MCTCVLNITVSLRARFLPPQHLVAKESSCFRRRSRGLVHLRVRLVCPAAQGGFLLRPARTLVAPSVAPLTVYLSRPTRRPRFVPEIRRVGFSWKFCSAGGRTSVVRRAAPKTMRMLVFAGICAMTASGFLLGLPRADTLPGRPAYPSLQPMPRAVRASKTTAVVVMQNSDEPPEVPDVDEPTRARDRPFPSVDRGLNAQE